MSWEIVPSGINIDFIGKRRLAAWLSVGVILASIIAIPIRGGGDWSRGIRMGIDFAGGTEVQVRFEPGHAPNEARIRSAVSGMAGVEDLSVIRFGDADTHEFLLKFRGGIDSSAEAGLDALRGAEEGFTGDLEAPPEVDSEEAAAPEQPEGYGDRVIAIEEALAKEVGPLTVQRVEFVGPRVGAELREDGAFALFWAAIVILVYIAFRFSSRFAPGAIVAVIHDLVITAGIFVILGLDFDLRILAAMLAILGYSLNDTIIIYDRIRENMAIRTTYDLPEVLNQSVNQTLSRTVLTSGTTLLTLLCLFFLGGAMIRPFAFAMIVGVLVGTYSSIFIAAPVLLFLQERYGAPGRGTGQTADVQKEAVRTAPSPPIGGLGPGPGTRPRRSTKRKSKKRR